MKSLTIEKPLLFFDGKYQSYKHITWLLTAATVVCMLIAVIFVESNELYIVPFVIFGTFLTPLGMWAESVSKHYEHDEPHYKAGRTKINYALHVLWVLLAYLWPLFWCSSFVIILYSLFIAQA